MRRSPFVPLVAAFLAACSGSAGPPEGPSAADARAGGEEGGSTAAPEAGPPTDAEGRTDRTADIAGDLSAGTRIATIRIDPTPIRVTRDDTVRIEGTVLDEAGNRLRGARWAVSADPSRFGVESIKDSIPDSYLLWGVRPGRAELTLWKPAAGDTAVDWEPSGRVRVTVEDWPVARVEIVPPEAGTYAGSTFPLAAMVLTSRDTPHETAKVAWSSADPEVVSITPEGGVATFRKPGRAEIIARAEGVEATLRLEVKANPVRDVGLEVGRKTVRTGDVVHLTARVSGEGGRRLDDVSIAYSVTATEGSADGASVFDDATFVARKPGSYRVVATAGGQSASEVITVRPRRVQQRATIVGRGPVAEVATSDLWVFEGRDGRDYAYTGTHAQGGGERMYAWDVTDPTSPVLTDSVVVDARVVNDVKVNEDATWAVITREGASSRRNGVVVLDVRDPAHPVVLAELTDSLTAGIHNTWIHGDVVYAVNDGTAALHILDLADPARPRHIGRWEARPGERDKYLHDVWAADGLAYLSYWNDGLVILDVGAGIAGGTPREPKFVSSYAYRTWQPEEYGNTHTAFRLGDYVFTGDEIFGCGDCVNGPRGYIHVIDVSDLENPREVARYEVPEAGAHNIWVEDDRLYIAYYQGGLRVVDVSGELRGNLYEQGREIAWFHTAGRPGEAIAPNQPMAWGPQPHRGNIFVSDMHSGLWVVKLEPPEEGLVP